MDAKPQRFQRNLRIRNDENAPPEGPLVKTIHNRNKSSPALSTMAGGGVFKPGAKRTAFGDVSNIVNIGRPSKDDSSLPNKTNLQSSIKMPLAIPEKKSAALLRPAQRPISVSSLRNLLTGISNSNTQEVAARHQASDSNVVSQPANTRRILSKRSTIIFKDTQLEPVKEHKAPVLPMIEVAEPAEISSLSTATTWVTDSKTILPPPSSTTTILDPIKEPAQLTSDTSLPGIDSVSLDPCVSSEGQNSFFPDPGHVINPALLAAVDQSAAVVESTQPSHIPPPVLTAKNIEDYAQPSLKLPPVQTVLPPTESQVDYFPTRPEPEEYWDEEIDDACDDEGFVTARSFRSREDNTTGGATTILFPQMNQKARREISAAKRLVEATRTPEEVEDESYDTSMVAEYGDEIFEYMRNLEVKMLPNAHYMDNQHEIQWSMRSVLMDWLVQVHHRFNLLPETLFLCVNYIDRFLSCKVVSLGKLQLVGATAIFIAAKYEEINCPSVQEIVYMVDGGYSIDEILKAERFMLTMLQFELGWPGPMSFLRRISKADDYDLETRTLAKYFLEITIMDERFIGSPPSFTAAASHCLARMMLRKGTWTSHHVYYSGYTFSQLRPLVALLLECCHDPRKHHLAVYNKYCDKRYKRASAFVETELQRGFRLPELTVNKSFIQFPTQTFFDTTSYALN